MKKDQNRIELQVRRGIYDEAKLNAATTANVLPGSLVELQEANTGYYNAYAAPSSLTGFDAAIILENALIGKAMNAKQELDEPVLLRRIISGDMYLIRAVAGTYTSGQPVYATQTTNGVYVSATGEGRFVGWAQENYTITSAMVDVIDDSTRDTPATTNINGALVNLLRVRIGVGKPRTVVTPDIDYTVSANGDASTASTALSITFASAPSTDLAAADVAVTPSTVATAGALTKVDSTHYTLALTAVSSGELSVVVTKSGVVSTAKTATVYYVAVVSDIDYTVSANGDATVPSTSVSITLASAPDADLEAADIAISPNTVATKGTLTKVDETHYTLAITAISAGDATVTITKTGVVSTGKTAAVTYAALVGYWGVAYPDAASPTATTPTAAQILALTSLNSIYGSKRNMDCAFNLNETDWTAAGGTGTFASDAAGRAFFITTDWGTASAIMSNSTSVAEAFDAFSVEIDGVTYSGYVANNDPVVYDGTTYAFTFVE